MTTQVPGPALVPAVDSVLARAMQAYRHRPPIVQRLEAQRRRLHEPLRVAIAGKVKAGKSTLLNALVGEQIAPTDAGECTRVITWYRGALSPEIVLCPTGGAPRPLPVRRHGGALVVDLLGHPPEQVERLVVHWPAASLRTTTLIDTPGMSSLSADVSGRSVRFLEPEDDTPTEADAVIYLMRHLHASDVRFLESFHDQGTARATSVNTVGVISRADEIGGGRLDAMSSALAVAGRYRREPALRGLCQNVVAVAGLLAETARTLRQDEFAALAELSRIGPQQLHDALLTTERFLSDAEPLATALPTLDADRKRALLARLGVFGIRLGTALVRDGIGAAPALADELVRHSGLRDLERILHTQFTERRDVLKARSGLLALDGVLRDAPVPDAERIAADVERILTGAHEFVELRLLGDLRSGAVTVPDPLLPEAERLLGDHGAAVSARLGLPPDADEPTLYRAALDALSRWQGHAEHPMATRATAQACRVVVRTCEGLAAAISPA